MENCSVRQAPSCVYSTPLKVYKNEEVYSSSKDFLATWVKPHISYSSLTIYPIGTKITFLNDNSGSWARTIRFIMGFCQAQAYLLKFIRSSIFCLVEVVENKVYLMIFPKIELNTKSSKSNASCLRLHFYNSERSLSHTLKALSHLFSKKSSIWFVSWFHTIIAVIYSYLGTFN